MSKLMTQFRKTWIYDELRVIRDSIVTFRKINVEGSVSLYLKVRSCHRKYGWYPNEYFLYNYEKLSDKERASFVSEIEHSIFADSVNSIKVKKLLADKWKTYVFYKKFFGREACVVTYANNGGGYNKLIINKKRLIIKPLDGSFGKGIKIVSEADNNAETLLKSYPGGFIAEEVIQQDERMSQLHPESVNTLRIHTLQNNGKVEIFHPYIRIGRGKSVVDNAGSGGVFTSCDPKNGEVLTVVDERCHSYTEHPDNGFPLVGFKVPCWKEAFDFARQLALENQDVHYAGWDLALTKNGWVLIEGNPCAQMVFQISEQKGFKGELEERCERIGLRKWFCN